MSNQLTIKELRAYQAGRLSGADLHRVERLLLEDPFYADVLEGLEALQQSGKSLTDQTADLRYVLHQRIHESANERRLMPLWVTSAAASILLVLGVAIYLIYFYQPAFTPVSPNKPMTFEVELMPVHEKSVGPDQVMESFSIFVDQNRRIVANSSSKGQVIITFEATEQGSVENLEIQKHLDTGRDQEAIRLVRLFKNGHWVNIKSVFNFHSI